MTTAFIRSGSRPDARRILVASGGNTLALSGEDVIVQKRRDGSLVEVALRALRTAPARSVEGSVEWDRKSGAYLVVHRGKEHAASLPDPVVSASRRIVRSGGIATLSGQAVVIGKGSG